MPNFLIIGAAKSGTTSLYRYLGQHPQIYMSPAKEPNFFALEGEKPDFRGPGDREALGPSVTEIGAYRGLFDGGSGEQAVGEASPMYLYSQKAPERIERHVPDAKLVALLRNPVERAYSAFLHLLRDGVEPFDDFDRALREEATRRRMNYAPHWFYEDGGFYYAQLSRYFGRFDGSNIRVYLYEDLSRDPVGLLQDIFGFLGVDGGFVPDVSVRHNVGGIPKDGRLHGPLISRGPVGSRIPPLVPAGARERVAARFGARNFGKPPPLLPGTRGRLIEVYEQDVLKLQFLIQRDLSKWLE